MEEGVLACFPESTFHPSHHCHGGCWLDRPNDGATSEPKCLAGMDQQWTVHCVHHARHFLGLSNEGAAMVCIGTSADPVVDLTGCGVHCWHGNQWQLALSVFQQSIQATTSHSTWTYSRETGPLPQLSDFAVCRDLARPGGHDGIGTS